MSARRASTSRAIAAWIGSVRSSACCASTRLMLSRFASRGSSAEIEEAKGKRVARCQVDGGRDDDRDNEAVNTDNTRHDNRDDASHDEVRLDDAHGADADGRLGGAVGGAEAAKRDRSGDSEGAEQRCDGRAIKGGHFCLLFYCGGPHVLCVAH